MACEAVDPVLATERNDCEGKRTESKQNESESGGDKEERCTRYEERRAMKRTNYSRHRRKGQTESKNILQHGN